MRKNCWPKKKLLKVDKAEVRGEKYVNALAGILEESNKSYYLVACERSVALICTIMDDCLKEVHITGRNFLRLLRDAASYVLKAAKTFKVVYLPCFM